MSEATLKSQLRLLADPGYQQFISRLLPTVNPETILGIRMPVLRKLAQQIANENPEQFFESVTDETYEERLLHGFVICYLDVELTEKMDHVRQFIPKIDNWAICDSFCSRLNLPEKYPAEMWDFILPYMHDQDEYSSRFGLVMLMIYYINEEYLDQSLEQLNLFKNQGYYARMAAAWAIASCFSKFPVETLRFLQDCSLDNWTYNKALQKIIESRTSTESDKKLIRSMKR